MRKIILICFALVIGLIAFGQPIVNRAGASNTVSDSRWQAQLNAFLPRYQDTTAANLQKGIDSAGAKIYTRNPQAIWYRAANPKRWVREVDVENISSILDSAGVNISVIDSNTFAICNGAGVCDTFHTSINYNTIQFITDSSVQYCSVDTVNGGVVSICDTLVVGDLGSPLIYQNWVRQNANIVEFGSNSQSYSPGLFLGHNTYTNTGYYTMGWHGQTVYDAPHQFWQQQSFQIGGGISSFLSSGNSVYGHPNSARLMIGYTADTSNRTPFIDGVVGSSIGYYLGTNGVQQHGSYGSYVDDNRAKTSMILLHQYDTTNTDAVTIIGAPILGGTAPVLNGQLKNYKIATFSNNGNIQFYGYNSLTRTDTTNITKALTTDEFGNVILGTLDVGNSANVGSGYRWLIPSTQEIKTAFSDLTITIDSSSNTNGLTFKVDTSVISTQYDLTQIPTGVANITIGENRTSTIVDKQTYSGFPSVAWTESRDTIFVAWKDGLNHADDGALMYTYSIDGGSTYVPYDTIYVDGSPAIGGTVEIGYMDNRLAILWTKGTNYTRIRAAYNNGRDRNFTGVDSVAAPASTLFAPYGAMVVMPSGKYMFPAYTWNSPSDSTKAIFIETTDNGLTWSIGSTIIRTLAAAAFPQTAISETYVIRVEDTATTDATTKLVAISRSDSYTGYHVLSYSTGGVTWTNTAVSGGVWAFGTQNTFGLPTSVGSDVSYPATMILDHGYVYATVDRRGQGLDYSSRVWKTPPSSIFNIAPTWGSYRTMYRALDAYKGSDIDWGYGRLFLTQTGELKKVSYDMSVSDRPGVDGIATSKRIRLAVNPVRGINAFEAFAAANQSISTGTETDITTNYIWLDTDSSYNSDSAKIYIPTDGYYEVTARLKFDTSSLGTYRQAKLYAVDWGTSYGTSPTRANYLLDKAIIQPSSTSDFNYIFLKATKYLYKGMQIKLTAQQDSGISLNILSSAYSGFPQTDDGRATITFKKIN